MQSKISAVVVTYNRKVLLVNNIKSCLAQSLSFSKIIIIDNNSTDGTYNYLLDNLSSDDFEKIDYVKLETNLGGAGGFSYGVDYAYKKGYDYIYLMDDDGKPMNENTLMMLVLSLKNLNLCSNAFVLNSLVLVNSERLSFGLRNNKKAIYNLSEISEVYIKDYINPFNGTLISRKTVETIGIPRSEYFIKGDEKEYQLRAKKFGIPIYTVSNSLYYHPSPYDITKRKIKKTIFESPWKEYYSIRNNCTNISEYSNNGIRAARIFFVKRLIKCILFCKKNKLKVFKSLLIGYKHYKIGKLGIYFLPDNSIYKGIV